MCIAGSRTLTCHPDRTSGPARSPEVHNVRRPLASDLLGILWPAIMEIPTQTGLNDKKTVYGIVA